MMALVPNRARYQYRAAPPRNQALRERSPNVVPLHPPVHPPLGAFEVGDPELRPDLYREPLICQQRLHKWHCYRHKWGQTCTARWRITDCVNGRSELGLRTCLVPRQSIPGSSCHVQSQHLLLLCGKKPPPQHGVWQGNAFRVHFAARNHLSLLSVRGGLQWIWPSATKRTGQLFSCHITCHTVLKSDFSPQSGPKRYFVAFGLGAHLAFYPLEQLSRQLRVQILAAEPGRGRASVSIRQRWQMRRRIHGKSPHRFDARLALLAPSRM
eukprot:3365832-Rhodomonas_salina.1